MSGESYFSQDRAELFEALGHPTRMKILRALASSPLSHSELKRATGIESSGLLAFHLNKLDGLVRSEGGGYALTDEGREALRIMAAEPGRTEEKHARRRERARRIAIAAAVLVVAVVAAYALYGGEYAKFDLAAESLQLRSFRVTNVTVLEANATGDFVRLAYEFEYSVYNPSGQSLGFHFSELYQFFELDGTGWGMPLTQASICTVEPNSTAVFRAVSPPSYATGYGSGSAIDGYLTGIMGRNNLLGSEGFDISGKALFVSGIFQARKQIQGWTHGWQDA